MNILWIPQISSKSSDGKVLLNKDSNMSVLRNLIGSSFCNENNIIIAFEFSYVDTIIDDAIKDNFICIFNQERKFSNAYMERFAFDNEFFENIKEKYTIDLVFVNEPTKVIQLRKIFDCKVVTYVHWLAFKNMPEILWRQYEGINASDICFVNSNYVVDELKNFYCNYFNIFFHNKFVKAQPTFTGEVKEIKNNAEFAFIYNHRLSSDKYYATAFETLRRICRKVKTISNNLFPMPIIYLTNPSGKQVELDEDEYYFKILNLNTQEEYNDFISSNKIIGHINTFFESEGMWSMSTVDCAITGNICLLPQKYGYAEIFEKDYLGYCKDENEMIEKIIDIGKNRYHAKDYESKMIKEHNSKIVGEKMNKEIKELFNGK